MENPTFASSVFYRDPKAALAWLERAFEGRAFWMFNLKVDPTWDTLRSEPGFKQLLRKMNLEGL